MTAVPAPPSALAFGSKSDVVLAPLRRRRGLPGWLIALLLVVGVFGGVAVLVFGAILNGSSWGSHNSAGDASGPSADEYKAVGQKGNFRFTPPSAPWQEGRTLPGAAVAFRRSKPASSMALVFHDYHTRLPRDPELIDDALKKLRDALSDVEYEVKPKDEQSTLGGQPAVRLEFQGGDHDVPVHGECVAMAYRGFAYWFYTWAPVDDAPGLVDEWAGLRGKFSLGNQGEGWTEKPPETAAVQGDKLPYKLEYIKSVWEKQEGPQKYSPLADAVLLGYDPKDTEPRIGANAATVQILALEKTPDLDAAVQKAKDALMDIEKEGEVGGVSLDVVADKLPNTDNNTDVGAFHGHVSKLEVKKSGDPSKYAVLAVVRMDDGGVLAVVCECTWDRRDYWDQEFTALLARLKPGKGK